MAGAATAIVALIGFSRVFLDLHDLSDVLAGDLVALVWLMIGSAMVEMAPTKQQLSHPSPCRRKADDRIQGKATMVWCELRGCSIEGIQRFRVPRHADNKSGLPRL